MIVSERNIRRPFGNPSPPDLDFVLKSKFSRYNVIRKSRGGDLILLNWRIMYERGIKLLSTLKRVHCYTERRLIPGMDGNTPLAGLYIKNITSPKFHVIKNCLHRPEIEFQGAYTKTIKCAITLPQSICHTAFYRTFH